MKTVPFGIAGVAAATGLLLFSPSLLGQDNDEPQPIVTRALAATVDYGNDAIFEPAKHATDFDRLGVLPETVVTIAVLFPIELAGQLVLAEPLDGGTVFVPEEGVFIGSDGSVTFQFQAGGLFGAARVSVHQPDDSNLLQFWIVDPEHPENTPPDLPGIY